MGAAIFAIAVVLAGVGSLVGLVRSIERADDPDRHYVLAIRFWRRVGAVGGLVAGILAYALLSAPIGFGSVAALTFLLMSLPPVLVCAAGIRNARVLERQVRRRRRALSSGRPAAAHVVALQPLPFAQDLARVTVDLALLSEADEPTGYRDRPRPVRHARGEQIVPAELARGLRVGDSVPASVDPEQPDVFTLWPDRRALPPAVDEATAVSGGGRGVGSPSA